MANTTGSSARKCVRERQKSRHSDARGGGRPAPFGVLLQAMMADASVPSRQLTLASIRTAANRPQCIYLMTAGFFLAVGSGSSGTLTQIGAPLQSLEINVRHWCVTAPVRLEEVRYITLMFDTAASASPSASENKGSGKTTRRAATSQNTRRRASLLPASLSLENSLMLGFFVRRTIESRGKGGPAPVNSVIAKTCPATS